MDSRGKSSHARKNRRRSTRNASINGDENETKDRGGGKRSRDCKDTEFEIDQDIDVYKDMIDLVPAEHLNCCPSEHPAAPGTRVNLHGVILHETQGGLIVLNVRWRNKVFSGALIDVEKNKWTADKLKDLSCDDKRFQPPQPIKKLKIPASSVTAASTADDSDSGNTKKKTVSSPTTPSKNNKPLRSANKKRGSQEVTSPVPSEEQVPAKKNKLKVIPNGGSNTELFECPEPNCGRKYKNKNGLTYHRRTVHDTARKYESFEELSGKEKSDSDSGEDNFVIDEKADEDNKDEEPKCNAIEEQNGSQSDEGDEDKKDEMTENEKKIERLKLKTEKALLYIKQESESSVGQDGDKSSDIPQEDIVATEVQDTVVRSEDKIMNKVETTDKPEPLVSVIEEKPFATTITIDEKKPNLVAQQIPTIQVDSSTVSDVITKKTTDVKLEDSHPKGSSQTIIHGDHLSSLNELFAPAQTYQQYSPTLSKLNPQILNDSLNIALAKTQQEGKLLSKENVISQAKIESKDIVKTALVPKPSLEIKRFEQTDAERKQFSESKLKVLKSMEMIELSQPSDIVDCSDDERSISPENLLAACHRTYPQKERDLKTQKTTLMPTSCSNSNLLLNTVLAQPIKSFENSLLYQELASKMSAASVNINSLQNKHLPLGAAFHLKELAQFSNIDQKNLPPHFLNYLRQAVESDPKAALAPIKSPGIRVEPKGVSLDCTDSQVKPSLLEQRLLQQPVKSESGSCVSSPISGQIFLQPNIGTGLSFSRPGETGVDNREKIPINSFTISRDRSAEKPKVSPSSLRINPPLTSDERIQMTTRTWMPEGIKDVSQQSLLQKEFYSNQPVSSSFRIPVTKTSTASSIHVYNPVTTDKNSKVVLKRSSQPIPIAPAPSSTINVPSSLMQRNELGEYTSPESDKEHPQMGRFTLTSDNRLIPSPAENRGRPRKVRVEKTGQIPIGTAQEIARSRGPADSPLMRKHPSGPVIRASVIQGANPIAEGSSTMTKPHERSPHETYPLFQHSRSFDTLSVEERERFAAAARQQLENAKLSSEARGSPAEKYGEYEGISSPPSMFRSRPSVVPRNMLSPPLSTVNVSSVDMLSVPSSILNPEILSSPHFHNLTIERMEKHKGLSTAANDHRNFLELHRGKPELLRVPPDSLRNVEAARKTPLSPRETLVLQSAYAARTHAELEKEHRLQQEFHAHSSRYQPPPGLRPDIPRSDNQRTMFDRRTPDENEQRLRERFLQQTPPSMHRNDSSTSHAAHSNNLVLGRADGKIIGPLSYDKR